MSVSGAQTPSNNNVKEETPQDSIDNINSNVNNENSFENLLAIPIKVNRFQSNGTYPLGITKTLHYSLNNLNVFQNLPKETARGIDDLTRLKMSLMSELPDEIKWSLKKYLAYSNKAPYIINLKENPDLLVVFKKFILDLKPLIKKFNTSIINTEENSDKIQMGLTSLLILRNLVQDSDSVQLLVQDNELKDFILFILIIYENTINPLSQKDKTSSSDKISNINSKSKSNPHILDEILQINLSYFNELIHYSLDLMEAISSYIAPAKKDDPFYICLVSILNFSKDRYIIISLLRSLSRLLVKSKSDEKSAADNLNDESLNLIVSFLLIESDGELITAALDLLYQFILPGSERISFLLNNNERFKILYSVLPKLLTFNNQLPNYSLLNNYKINLIKRLKPPVPKNAPDLPIETFKALLKLDEPKRSTAWLKCCFEPVTDSEVTQIVLWRNYESKFSTLVRQSGRKLLPAVEFIKNVSTAFEAAAPMVITDSSNGKKRFVIKNIQPRLVPLTIKESQYISTTPSINTSITTKYLHHTSTSSDDNSEDFISPAKQAPLPKIRFANNLSELSKAAATFLCLLSNDESGIGSKFSQDVKPIIFQHLADIPPLTSVLTEYMDNTHGNIQ
ncbi:hypothetical protein TBLA_0G03620 [Henningerozyma blattae CBS 6284]|uniref:RFX-type winged-helix domain-containing protein n=1 Tax=Henningerozyma blattae (strain ATCC 34711 / CBS 6284 / DSM 70876 / NBRC 10599 / NRRL Y-10934 / UCD 77-7) TaxID=1071380 RepID=I2H7E4_HENB6|nr:hypothetical protein TBLA_0G03620 [Tetrapisispora blattae CBS 6284]CCH62296.1 hypothetical protein TBLA_0G03620 [Tetrapisispora blattae CBS 6284]